MRKAFCIIIYDLKLIPAFSIQNKYFDLKEKIETLRKIIMIRLRK